MFRLMLTVIWGGIILLLTTTSNFSALIVTQTFQIEWTSHPDFSQLLEVPHTIDEGYLLQKLGHIIVFFILILFSQRATRKIALIAICFAALTEILQLYCGRSGRLLDMGYDIFGILIGVAMLRILVAVQTSGMKTQDHPNFSK